MLPWLCFMSIFVIGGTQNTPNVCPNNLDYFTKEVNKDCWYDPDVEATLEGIINNHQLSVKNYSVTTEDGYSLIIFRITGTLNNPGSLEQAQPLFFQHGIFRDARCWLLRGDLSPAIYYAKKGYQVWLGNVRGTEFSSHQNYPKDSREFWDFTFHEIGTKDVPTIINKIIEVTNQAGNIIYVGHSMGTTASYIYCSENSIECNKNLKTIISLAPVAYLNKIPAPFVNFLSEVSGPIEDASYLLHNYDFSVRYMSKLCLHSIGFCKAGLEYLVGKSEPDIYDQIFPIVVTHGDAPFSVKMARHFAQIIASDGIFGQYNNDERNESPIYDVSKIIVDVHLIYANNDLLATEPDVKVLKTKLVGAKTTITVVPSDDRKLSHLDFIIAAEMEKEILTPITRILDQYK